jgi:hypothetical protein
MSPDTRPEYKTFCKTKKAVYVSFYVSKNDFSGIGYKYRVSTTNR